MACGFPFGLWEASRPLEVAAPLLVWPRTFPVGPVPDAEGSQASDGLATRDRAGHWGDPLGVRPYRRGDPLRRVHWGLTARHGELIVREVQSNAVPRVQIVLDSHAAAHAGSGPDGSREWAIRVAASLAEGWIAQGAEVELVLDGRSILPRGGSARARSRAVLDAMARFRPRGDRDLAELFEDRRMAAARRRAPGRRHDRRRPARARRRRPSFGARTASSCSRPGRSVATRAGRRPLSCPWSPGSGSTARDASRRASGGPGRRSRLVAEGREDDRVRWTTLAMAGLATVALEQAVLEPGRSRAIALAWTAGLLIAPALVASWRMNRGGRERLPHTATLVALLVLFALPFANEAARLVLTGRSAMAEVTLLSALRNLGLGLAAMAHRPVYARLSALVSLFLVTVASSVGGEAGMAVLAPVGRIRGRRHALADAGLLEGARRDGRRGPLARRLPISGAAWVLAVVGAGRGGRGGRALAGGHRAGGPGAHLGRHRLERPRRPLGRRRRRQRGRRQRASRIRRVHRERGLPGDRPAQPLRRLQRDVRRAVQAEEDRRR